MKSWFIEVVQDFDGTYYANMMLGGHPVTGLPENVKYNALRDAIRQKTGVEILKRGDMKFQQFGRKKYAYLDATQERTDCRVTLEELDRVQQGDSVTDICHTDIYMSYAYAYFPIVVHPRRPDIVP